MATVNAVESSVVRRFRSILDHNPRKLPEPFKKNIGHTVRASAYYNTVHTIHTACLMIQIHKPVHIS